MAPAARTRAYLPPLILFFGTQALYIATLHRSIPPWDSGEFITAALTKGLAHPPGYPLFTLLGILSSNIPFGSSFARVNFLSALCGSGAVTVVYLACRSITNDVLASFLASAMLAVGTIFWRFSVVAEVFTLHCALVAALLLSAIRYRQSGDRRLLWAMSALFGLGASHLHTVVLIGPTILWLALRERRIPGGWVFWAGLLAALGAGLLPYLYLPWAAARDSPASQISPSSWSSFLDVFLRRTYGSMSLSPHMAGNRLVNMVAQIDSFGRSLLSDQRFAGMVVALVGAWRLWRMDRVLSVGLFVYLFLSVPLFLWLANAPASPTFVQVVEKQFGGPLVVLSLFTAVGFSFSFERARRLRHGLPACVFGAAMLFLAMLAGNYRICDRSRDKHAERAARLVLEHAQPRAIIFSCYDTMNFALHALRDAGGLRPDIVLSSAEPARVEADRVRLRLSDPGIHSREGRKFTREVISRHAGNRPIYFTFANVCNNQDLLADLRDHLVPEGLLYRWAAIRTPALVEQGIANGRRMLAARPELMESRISEHSDAGVREVMSWYADAFNNLGVMAEALGRTTEAQALHARGFSIRR